METLTLHELQTLRGALPPLCAGYVYVSSLAMKTYKKTPLLKRWCEVRVSEDGKETVMEFFRNQDDFEPTKRIHLSFARVVVSRGSRLTVAQLARIPHEPSGHTGNHKPTVPSFYIDFPRLRTALSSDNPDRPLSPPMFETRSIKADLSEIAEDFPLGFIMVVPDMRAARRWERVLIEGCKLSVPRERKRVRVQRWINRAWMRLRGDLSIDQFDEGFRSTSLDTEFEENFFSIGPNKEFSLDSEEGDDACSNDQSFQTAGGSDSGDEEVERQALGTRTSSERFLSAPSEEDSDMTPKEFLTVQEMFAEKRDDIRHSVKISKNEIASVVAYVEATKSFSDSSPPHEWSLCSEGESFDCFKSIDEGSGVVRTRAWAKIAGVAPQTLFYMLYNNAARRQWDHHYAKFETEWTDPEDPSLDIIDAVVTAPFGCANREFLEWRRCQIPDKDDKNGKFVIYLRSWSPPDARPVQKGAVRAEVWLSGYLIQWWYDETTGARLGTDVMVMTQIDIKGLIPKYLVNALSSSAPKKWVKGVTAAATAELDKRGIDCLAMTDAALHAEYGLHAT